LEIILKLFCELTEMLNDSKYPALSFVTPAIENLKQHLSIYQPKNDIIQQIIDNILDNLKKNFGVPSTLGLYGSFFDPRFKKLLYIKSELRSQILDNLREQFTKLIKPVTSNTIDNDSKMLTFFQIFIEENRQTEFDKYIELPQLPITEENNPLRWWSENKNVFPTMAKLARKYLSVTAFSVPNGELFPDEKNQCLDFDILNYTVFLKHNLLLFGISN
ncbi:9520_t:CDS:2, partial [Dentiscutata heterogama]